MNASKYLVIGESAFLQIHFPKFDLDSFYGKKFQNFDYKF